MSPLSNIWRQLVQRRLWPVAVLLVAGLAAVPIMLAQEPEIVDDPAPAPQAVTAAADSELATTPIVTPAQPADRDKRRKVLGKSKNPFAKPPKLGGSAAAGPEAADKPKSASGGSGSGGLTRIDATGGGTPSAPSAPSSPPADTPSAPTEPDVKPAQPARHSLAVRFGSDDSLERMNVKKHEALPVGEEPLVVYLGVADGGKSAVFLIDSSVDAQGDGECMPDENTCETVHLREGETEFFDILGADGEPVDSYQLDLVEIHEGKNTSAARTARTSKAVRRVLKAHAASPTALQYEREDRSGELRPVVTGVARTADVGLPLGP